MIFPSAGMAAWLDGRKCDPDWMRGVGPLVWPPGQVERKCGCRIHNPEGWVVTPYLDRNDSEYDNSG
jgi:hypothetical protein